MLPRRDLLEGSPDPAALEPLIAAAEEALRTWQPQWTSFLAADLREEAQARLESLSELSVHSEGGFAGAERKRLLLQRRDAALEPSELPDDLCGLEISGNFLFDPAEANDVRRALEQAGAAAGGIGDIWMRGDRGAQALVTAKLAAQLTALIQEPILVRSVPVELQKRPIAELQLPQPRARKRLTSVEASLRLDALASAGFGMSRSRMAELIRQGAVRLNWRPVASASRELAVGDRVQLEGRGELLLEEVSLTKRERWRVVLERR